MRLINLHALTLCHGSAKQHWTLLVLQVRIKHIAYPLFMPSLGGFNYKFDSLNPDAKPNELNKAFTTLFHAGTEGGIYSFLREGVALLRIIVCVQQHGLVYHLRQSDC